jgi:two-component system chemotaxis sensor kinase CheA
MNEFIEQFLVEARELVDQATADLLALEDDTGAADRLDSAFRAFHTLKGGAGIVDFHAMGWALHAAEDRLSAARGGAEPVTTLLISDCLTCLDQVVQWLDAMAADGEVPSGADAEADALVRRFSGPAARPPDQWLAALLGRQGRDAARSAILYRPDADAFFRGEDPLALVQGLPGLLALEIEPQDDAPSLEGLDPYACSLVIRILTSIAPAQAAAHFSAVAGQIQVVPVSHEDASLPTIVQRLLAEQLLLLAEPASEGQAGRRASAARTAANALRSAGRAQDPDRLEQAGRALPGPDDPLVDAIRAAMSGPLPIDGGAAPAARGGQAITRSLRVDIERIDALVKLAGELTVVKNALGHAAALAQTEGDPKVLSGLLKDQHALLERLLTELQGAVLNIRVLPLGQVFQRFPRVVREMAADLGKPVRFSTDGDDTEADKVVVEALFEPLLHVIRNALDHGVESPAERARTGKPPTAALRLRAARRGESVLVEIEDDGAGIDVRRVREVARTRGMAAPEVIAELSDEAVIDLIFAPGFSTAAEVTDLSGRGVGMDVVRTALERLGGKVSVESRPGAGALVRFILPFTVMMSRVMTVEAGGQLFGAPLEAVVETVRTPRDRIATIGAGRAFVLRDRTIPLVSLAGALGEDAPDAPGEEVTVMVTTVGGQLVGLEVDRIGERMDVMLKPMEGLLAGLPGIAGATLLGDGRVLLVLDLNELLQ